VSRFIVGVDIGGTFTDLVAHDTTTGEMRSSKVPSTPPGYIDGVVNALDRIDAPAVLTNDAALIRAAQGVIVPGVGAAQDTMRNLEQAGLVEPLLDVIRREVPYLGICMGMQALMTFSEEHGGQPCLDVIPGRVRRMATSLPVPLILW